jgi:hypothetical protein
MTTIIYSTMATAISTPPIDTDITRVMGVSQTVDRMNVSSASIFSTDAVITTFLDHPTPIVHPPSTLEKRCFPEFISVSMPPLDVVLRGSPNQDMTFYWK